MHEPKLGRFQAVCKPFFEAIKIVVDMRSQVTVDHGGITSGYQLDHGDDLGGKGNLGKTYFFGQFADKLLMLRTAVCM